MKLFLISDYNDNNDIQTETFTPEETSEQYWQKMKIYLA